MLAAVIAIAVAVLLVGGAWFWLRPTPFVLVKQKMAEGELVTILVWSDSTGNGNADPREWPYLFGDWLADRFPASPIHLWQWLEDPEGYADPVSIADGAGGPPITLANFAVPGANMAYGMGERWGPAISRWKDPDLVIVNLGLNYAGYENEELIRPPFEEGIARLRAEFPKAPVLLVKQNPFSDNDTMDLVYRIIDDIARNEGMATADVAGLFKANSEPAKLFLGTDNTHPNQAGQDLYLDAITALW